MSKLGKTFLGQKSPQTPNLLGQLSLGHLSPWTKVSLDNSPLDKCGNTPPTTTGNSTFLWNPFFNRGFDVFSMKSKKKILNFNFETKYFDSAFATSSCLQVKINFIHTDYFLDINDHCIKIIFMDKINLSQHIAF